MKLSTFILFGTLHFPRARTDNEYPDIQDLFIREPDAYYNSTIEPIQNIDIDLERIDMDKFKEKLDGLEAQLLGANETRRQRFPYISGYQHKRASRYIMKVKTLDLMLQAIYMTRHRVRQLENEKHFNKKDTGYRVAFIYRKLRRLWRKMMDLFSMKTKKVNFWFYNTDLNDALKMHQKVIKLYEEFQYLYWVLIAIDGKFLNRMRTTKKPKSTKADQVTKVSRTRPTTPRPTLGIPGGN